MSASLRRSQRSSLATTGFTIVLAILGAALYRGFGTTWDDPFHARVGSLALQYFQDGFSRDVVAAIERFGTARLYGPLHDMVPSLARSLRGDAALDPALFDLRHAWNFAFALLLVPAIAKLTRGLASPWLPLFACIALFSQPRFFGDAFLNSIDGSFAVAMAWLFVALLRLVRADPLRRREFVLLGLAIGFVLIERPGALPLALVLLLGAFALRDLLRRKDAAKDRGILVGFALALALAWVLMVLPWPPAHREPLVKPLEAMSASVRFVESYPVLDDGKYVSSSDLPRSHVPRMFLITTPLGTLGLAALGLLVALRRLVRAPRSRPARALAIVILWLAVPLAGILIARPNVYDGVRHFLFVLPSIAILAGLGAVVVAALLRRSVPRLGFLANACAGALLLLPVSDLVALHPYEYAFFNRLVGGVAGASGRFETEYFATSYREGMALVNEAAAKAPSRRFTVAVGGSGLMLPGVAAHARENVDVVLVRPDEKNPSRLPDDVDFYLGVARFQLENKPFEESPVIATIGREGATFAVLRAHAH